MILCLLLLSNNGILQFYVDFCYPWVQPNNSFFQPEILVYQMTLPTSAPVKVYQRLIFLPPVMCHISQLVPHAPPDTDSTQILLDHLL